MIFAKVPRCLADGMIAGFNYLAGGLPQFAKVAVKESFPQL